MSSTRPQFLRRYMRAKDLLPILESESLRLSNWSKWTDKNDQAFLQEYQTRNTNKKAYALCFTGPQETVHHWHSYADSGKGVCIEIKREPFLAGVVKSLPGSCHGPMNYVKQNDFTESIAKNTERLPFIKRHGFQDEREYRVIYLDAENRHSPRKRPSVALPWNVIAKIQLGPAMSESAADDLKDKLDELELPDRIRISRATLFDNKTWIKRLEQARPKK